MKIKEFRLVLEDALRSDARWAEPDQAAALKDLVGLLAQHDALSVEEFCKQARVARAPSKKKAGTKAPLNEVGVTRHLTELRSTAHDAKAFETAVRRLKADKQMRVGEVKELANRFLGKSRTYRSKTAAIDAIMERQIADIRASNKIDRIQELF